MTAVDMTIIPDCGQEQLAARQPHKLEVRGSSPRPANFRRNEQGGSHGRRERREATSAAGCQGRRPVSTHTATQTPPARDGGAGPAGLENRNETRRWGSRRGCGGGGVGGGWRVDRACSIPANATFAAAIRPVATASERGTGTRPAAGPERLREPGQGDHHRVGGDDCGGAPGSVRVCDVVGDDNLRAGYLLPAHRRCGPEPAESGRRGISSDGRAPWRRGWDGGASGPLTDVVAEVDGSSPSSRNLARVGGSCDLCVAPGVYIPPGAFFDSMYPAARLVAVPGELRYCGCWRGDGPV